MQNPQAVPEAADGTLEIAQAQEAADNSLKLAQARGESPYVVSVRVTLNGTTDEAQFERIVSAANEEEAGDRAMDLLIWDPGPDYLEVTEVTPVSESVAPC